MFSSSPARQPYSEYHTEAKQVDEGDDLPVMHCRVKGVYKERRKTTQISHFLAFYHFPMRVFDAIKDIHARNKSTLRLFEMEVDINGERKRAKWDSSWYMVVRPSLILELGVNSYCNLSMESRDIGRGGVW
jgi:hypothetical protein